MKLRTLLFISFVFFVSVNSATAQVPVATQPASLKVGVINSDLFANPNGGITKYTAALRTLETEFRPLQDEIRALVTRLEGLGKQPTANVPQTQLIARREQAETLQLDIKRKQEDARVAYGKRFSTLTDPIRLSIFNALEAYTKARGIDVLIDVAKFPDGVLLVNKNADMTAAFIKDFNTKNP